MYTSSILISNYLQRDLTEHEEAYLMVLIPAIKSWLDRKLSSTFDKVEPSTRYFDGGSLSIDIDPCTDITAVGSVNIDATLTANYPYTLNTEYRAEPVNENVKRELRYYSRHWPYGTGNIAVTAKFSEYDNGVPEDIRIIATTMAAEVLNQGTVGSTGVVASESLEGHSITYDTGSGALDGIASSNPNVKSLIELHRELFVG